MHETGSRPPPRPTGPDDRWRPRDAAWLAIAVGCVIGLAEVAALGVRRSALDRLTHVTPHVVWLAPPGYAFLFVALVPPLFALRRAGRRFRRPYPAEFLFGARGVAGWIAMLPWSRQGAAIARVALSGGVTPGVRERRPEADAIARRSAMVARVDRGCHSICDPAGTEELDQLTTASPQGVDLLRRERDPGATRACAEG